MTLDEELRATLGLEAGTRTVPQPDVTGMIHRGRARRRRRTLRRATLAFAATVVAGAVTIGVVTADPRTAGEVVSPSRPTPPAFSSDGRRTMEPGTHRMFVGHDAAGATIAVDVTVGGPHWKRSDFPLVSEQHATTYAGVGVYQPWALASGDGCEAGPTVGPLARTPAGLAAQLVELPRSTVLRGPERARVAGRTAVHLRLRIAVDCPTYYRVAHAASGPRGITYTPVGLPVPDVVIDFWVLDVDGAVIIIDEWHNTDAPAGVTRQARDARRSITFVGGD